MSSQDNNSTDYDVIIIGGAAAGLTAALYASRKALRTLVIAKALGGQAAMTPSIENYPGTQKIGGIELMSNFLEHAKANGAQIKYETAAGVGKKDDAFEVKTNAETYHAPVVILAYGLTPRNMDVPGEKEFQGKGVTYCATCDGPLFKNRKTAVVGGTQDALESALYLAKLGSEVTLIHDKDGYPAWKNLFEQVQANSSITVMLNTEVVRVEGDKVVSGIVVNGPDGEATVEVAGIFVEKGHRIDSSWCADLVECNPRGMIRVNKAQETKTPGLFAAGDVTNQRDKQVVISAAAGAVAALSAFKYLQEKEGKNVVTNDWEHSEE
ncbi:MAG: FAD-dependent oxidoreductase [Candidatus Kerfeldbacteria bacterium]